MHISNSILPYQSYTTNHNQHSRGQLQKHNLEFTKTMAAAQQANTSNSKSLSQQRGELEKIIAESKKKTPSTGLLPLIDATLEMGIHALGGEEKLREWAKKGLVANREDILSAMKLSIVGDDPKARTKQGAGGWQINPYALMRKNHTTPDWFNKEEQSFINTLEDPKAKKAFFAGKISVFTPVSLERF